MTTAQDQQSREAFASGIAAASVLRAMAMNYRTGHAWDALDERVCTNAANEIDRLNAELQAARALPAGMEPVAEVTGYTSAGGGLNNSISRALPQGTKLYTAAQVQAMLAAEKVDMGIPVELIAHEPVLQPLRSLRSPECWCECCDTVAHSGFRSRMSLCPQCGDKRCPRAFHHNSDCSAP